MLVIAVRIEDTHEKAIETATPGHDEFWKFLGPYGWSRGYMGADGKPAPAGLIPTLDESIENKTILVGTPEEVAEGIAFYRDLLGLRHLTIFPHLLGDPYKKADEQMARFIEEVVPLVGLQPAACLGRRRQPAPVRACGAAELLHADRRGVGRCGSGHRPAAAVRRSGRRSRRAAWPRCGGRPACDRALGPS